MARAETVKAEETVITVAKAVEIREAMAAAPVVVVAAQHLSLSPSGKRLRNSSDSTPLSLASLSASRARPLPDKRAKVASLVKVAKVVSHAKVAGAVSPVKGTKIASLAKRESHVSAHHASHAAKHLTPQMSHLAASMWGTFPTTPQSMM